MSGEKDNNLFEEMDFGMFAEELEQSVGDPAPDVDDPEANAGQPAEEDFNNTNDTDDGESQAGNDPEEDADPSEGTEDPTDDDSEDNQGGEEDNSSPLTPYAKLLVDEGILPNFDLEKFDGTADGLKAAMTGEITSGIEDYKSQLPGEIKKLLDNYEEGVPLSRLLDIDEKRTEYKAIKPEQLSDNKELQKAIMRDYYKNTTKFSDTKIDKLIQTSEDLENLESESQEALTDLVAFQDEYEAQEVQKAQQAKVEAQKAQEKALETFKDTLEKTNEIVSGIQISKGLKDTLYKVMTTPVAYDENGTPLNKVAKYRVENPYEFDIKLSYLFEVTKGFTDWSVLSSAGKTSAAKSFEEAVARQEYKGSTGKGGKRTGQPKTSSNLLDEISKFKFE